MSDLHGPSHLSWVVTAYLLALTISVPMCGTISDLHGRETVRIGEVALEGGP